MKTNYEDPKLLDAAVALYQSESTLSQHYETLRSAVTGTNLALVAGVVTFEDGVEKSLIWILIMLALVAGLLTLKLSQAFYFHFMLASKMRGVIAKHHPKTNEKLIHVRSKWGESVRYWRWVGHAPIWVVLNFLIPLLFAAQMWMNA